MDGATVGVSDGARVGKVVGRDVGCPEGVLVGENEAVGAVLGDTEGR